MKIKICGLTRMRDIDIVNELQPDYIGMIFAESRRRVTAGDALSMKRRLQAEIKAVGVFVNAEREEIARIAESGAVDLIQLHGDEDATYIEELRSSVKLPIIKAVRVRSPGQVLAAQGLPCPFLLLDTFQKGAYGGTGKAIDLSLIPALQKPYFLAGGLFAGNIRKAAALRPYGLDISSGVETDGLKDAEKIREIIRIVREEC
jgi:phosphoribosylanthranilate isomerase